ncbi:MAG: SP_1767 family glycosyltransferase [Lachnospiraceae bacterium]|nr:SP_1767 family glycosyltransferase [Lachnospiraceae bacterium]
MAVGIIKKIKHFVYCTFWIGKDNLTKGFIGKPQIQSIEATYEKILTEHVSVSRFGDGEFKWMAGISQNSFQDFSKEMQARLLEICKSDLEGHIVCLSDTFGDLKKFNAYGREFWGCFMGKYRKEWMRFLKPGKMYYNTNMTRPYMDYLDKSPCAKRFFWLKKIWENRKVVLIEGEKSRLGVGNDLFSTAASVQRILAPATNAFAKYEELLERACLLEKDTLILLALGPTATILAYDLAKKGYQALDIGHVDVEYEWFQMKANEKVPLKHKYVNESLQGRNIGELKDANYNSQIMDRIQ